MLVQFSIAFAAALAVVIVARLVPQRLVRRGGAPRLERELDPIVFLFREGRLVDATSPARSLLATMPGSGDWQKLMGWLATRMPDCVQGLAGLGQASRIELSGAGGLDLLAEDLGEGHLRLTLADPQAEAAGITMDSLSLTAMQQELAILRSTMDHSPMLAWREDGDGNVTWANSAYLQMAEDVFPGETLWPLPRLIDLPIRSGQADTVPPRRAQVRNDTMGRWYDCHVHDIAGQTVAIALPADAAVRAERSLREFVQTLTKTFADLPIGLAIFDRDRNLQLFNPALIDLTGLATGFLTARPTLYAFLDRLREARMVPEPKDYRSWRQQMNTLEAAAASGHHVEIWSLPGGQTYRVTGRPHPDGAVAFLFDDITSEISLTRKFRADLSLGADVLDSLDEAIAVFAANGEAELSNRRYSELWGEQRAISVKDCLACWGGAGTGSPGLAALRQALSGTKTGQVERGVIAAPSGGLLSWSVRPLSGGRAMVGFTVSVELADAPVPHTETETGPLHRAIG